MFKTVKALTFLFVRSFSSKHAFYRSFSHVKEHFLQKQNAIVRLITRYRLCKLYIETRVEPLEFFLFDYENKSKEERNNFLPDYERVRINEVVTGRELFNDLKDKYRFYELNKEFFQREVYKITKETTYQEFQHIVTSLKKVFAKPIDGSLGKGAFIVTESENIECAYNTIKNEIGTGWVAEEYIVQSNMMSAWNKTSINTVRIPTFLTPDGVKILAPFIRTGRKGAIVDNAGGGGIFAAIDEKNGLVVSDGMDEQGNKYQKHPESGMVYKGFQIPEWESLIDIATKAHLKMDKHRYIAYDFAHTDNGWVMIEGNWGQFLAQFALNKGLRKEFMSLMIQK